jgi:hypothetical protein
MSCLDFLDRNWRPVVPRVEDYDSSPRASIERVAGAIHLMGGTIVTDMSLQVPPRDSVVNHGAKASTIVTRNPTVVPTCSP